MNGLTQVQTIWRTGRAVQKAKRRSHGQKKTEGVTTSELSGCHCCEVARAGLSPSKPVPFSDWFDVACDEKLPARCFQPPGQEDPEITAGMPEAHRQLSSFKSPESPLLKQGLESGRGCRPNWTLAQYLQHAALADLLDSSNSQHASRLRQGGA